MRSLQHATSSVTSSSTYVVNALSVEKANMRDTAALDRDVAALHSSAGEWVTTPLAEKRKLLEALCVATAQIADEWVRVSCQGKGIAPNSPAAGEEWMSGPYALISNVAALIRLVEQLETGTNPLDRVRVRTLPGGRVALRAFPAVAQDLVLAGYTGSVWLRPGVTLEQAKAGVASRLRDTNLPGQVGLVLGAGNINSIPPLDGLTKLYQDNAVVMIKLNPVNAYLEPVLNRAFAPFVECGFVRITAGGIDVGSSLVRHPEVDAIHITGSSASHDAIVFGPGEEGARRKQAREPLITKPITSELGGVGPAVVVPGRWRDAALRLQAQNVATQRLHNSGFNCIATQIVVLPQKLAAGRPVPGLPTPSAPGRSGPSRLLPRCGRPATRGRRGASKGRAARRRPGRAADPAVRPAPRQRE